MRYVGGFVDRDYTTLVYRTADGVRRGRQFPVEWVTYFKLSQLGQYRNDIERSTAVLGARVENDEWLRVRWATRDARYAVTATTDRQGNDIPNWFRMRGIVPYENDVSPVRRFFSDNNAETEPWPRVAYLDIETDSRLPFSKREQMRVLCWTVVAGCDCPEKNIQEGDVIFEGLEEFTDESEKELLDKLWTALEPFDVVAAWYGDGFDFPVIRARTLKVGLSIQFEYWRFVDHLRVYELLNKNVAETGDEKSSLALNSVCQAVLGKGKHDFDASKTYQAWESGGAERERMFAYCRQDTKLLKELEDKTGYLKTFGTMCAACRLFMETYSLKSSIQMDGFMLRLGRESNYHFPSTFGFTPLNELTYKGAWVMSPKLHGIIPNVHVADFSSLYPSIMISWNMSPETVNHEAPINGPIPPNSCRAPGTGVVFRTDVEGLLPKALNVLLGMRKEWADKKSQCVPGTPEFQAADRWSMAYKVLANSFYGVVGSTNSRYHDRRIAESVTQTGAWLNQTTVFEAEKVGIMAFYGDTDSFFANQVSKDRFANFVEWCNVELYPRLLKERGCTINRVKLAYEKEFAALILLAAKKYFGFYQHYKGKPATAKSKPEVKGMEYRRGDSIAIAREMQGRVIDIFHKGVQYDDNGNVKGFVAPEPTDVLPILEEYRDRTLSGNLDLNDIVLAQSLTQPISEYKAKTPPAHIRVAMMLRERGKDVSPGTRIRYVVIDGSKSPKVVIPAEDWTGEYDCYAVWEDRLFPPTGRVLEVAFPNHNWKPWFRVRPKKRRGATAKEQPSLPLHNPKATPPKPVMVPPKPVAPPPMRPTPLTVRINATTPDSRQVRRAILSLKPLIESCEPGDTKVIIEVSTGDAIMTLLVTNPITPTAQLIAILKKKGWLHAS
jgi:DNA polymerase I